MMGPHGFEKRSIVLAKLTKVIQFQGRGDWGPFFHILLNIWTLRNNMHA